MAKVICKGIEKSYEDGTKLAVVARDFQDQYDADIIISKYKGKLTELNKAVSGVGEVQFLTLKDKDGVRAYRRSVTFMMQCALMDMLPEEANLIVEHSLGNGYFCTIKNGPVLTADDIERLKKRMLSIVEQDIPLKKYSMKTQQARDLFKSYYMFDKEQLLKYRTSSNINLYDLDGCTDYFYGYMVYSTGVLKHFDIIPYQHGFILLFPSHLEPNKVAEFEPRPKLFAVLQRAIDFGDTMKIPTVGALNEALAQGRIQDIILSQEAIMERQIGELAQTIANNPSIKFVMMAGPSSSGKTTFSHKLSAQLRALGCVPHPIPLDDYYLNRDQMPLDEFGQKDFESIEGLDIAQFNEDMSRLLAGERVELPTFNFKVGRREYNGKYMQLGENDILVIEGIHGLNDRMSASLPSESKYKIYLSALTQLSIDEHNPLSTSDGRLIRRIVRDARTRGTSAADTIAMWDSVRRGEEKNIFPFQEKADFMFNSALIYEMAVLKLYALPQLYAIEPSHPMYSEAKRLIKLLDYFLPMAPDDIPNNSLIREFIGGSCLNV